MVKILLKKSLVCGIIILFLGMNMMPIAGNLSIEIISSVKDLNKLVQNGS